MRILFVPVNYNSYPLLEEYLQSVCQSRREATDEPAQVDVWIADNSPEPKDCLGYSSLFKDINIKTFRYDNPGYLSAALQTIQKANSAQYDYIIISNVDVRLTPSFLSELRHVNIDNNIAWIAPAIFSEGEKRDVNPKITERYSKRHLKQLQLLFRFPLLYYIYTKTLYRRKALSVENSPRIQKKIYAGHGSLMIFTGGFFAANPLMEYPVFLFCEEIFLAEKVRNCGGTTIYCPSVKVIDKEHASTGLMHLSQYCKYNYDALTYIIKTFYE